MKYRPFKTAQECAQFLTDNKGNVFRVHKREGGDKTFLLTKVCISTDRENEVKTTILVPNFGNLGEDEEITCWQSPREIFRNYQLGDGTPVGEHVDEA